MTVEVVTEIIDKSVNKLNSSSNSNTNSDSSSKSETIAANGHIAIVTEDAVDHNASKSDKIMRDRSAAKTTCSDSVVVSKTGVKDDTSSKAEGDKRRMVLTRQSKSLLSDDSYLNGDGNDSEADGAGEDGEGGPLTPQTCHNTTQLSECSVYTIAQLIVTRHNSGNIYNSHF